MTNDRVLIQFNTPTKVSKLQYDILRSEFQGVLAFREDSGKGEYFVNLFVAKYKSIVQQILDKCHEHELQQVN